MAKYLVRRLLFMLPTLWVVSLIVFGLSCSVDSDPLRLLRPEAFLQTQTEAEHIRRYALAAEVYGLDKPAFYCSLTTAAFPDTLHRIVLPERREQLAALAAQTGNWPAVQTFADEQKRLVAAAEQLPDSPERTRFQLKISQLENTSRLADLFAALDSLLFAQKFLPENVAQNLNTTSLAAATQRLWQEKIEWRGYVPKFVWHGSKNQYHRWFTGFLSGNMGTSLNTRAPVWNDLRSRLGMTVGLNLTAILLAYLLALPLGTWLARRAGSGADRWVRQVLLALYAMPMFWLGGLLVLLFATEGVGLKWIGGTAPGGPQFHNLSNGEWLLAFGDRLILPILVLTLHFGAVLALQMRGSVLGVLGQNFIRTARAKGLPESEVVGRHAFRNALFPAIAIFGGLFPTVFAGSLVVEYLFGIRGMGMMTFDAYANRDFPVLFAVVMCSAVLTVVGSLVADLLFACADPRVRFTRR